MVKRQWFKLIMVTLLMVTLTQIHKTELLAQSTKSWNIYVDPVYGFTAQYPSDWMAEITLKNYGREAGVIEQRLLFSTQTDGINIDVFPNPQGANLEEWFRNYQLHFMYSDSVLQDELIVAGHPALYTLTIDTNPLFVRHTTIIEYKDYIYRIEYQGADTNEAINVYRMVLETLDFEIEAQEENKLFDPVDIDPYYLLSQIPLEQGCCGYTDPNYNPYPCHQGNCTWWARYKRPDTGGQQYPYWGNAGNWAARAREEGFVVNGTPSTSAIAEWSYGHVAYVESFDGTTADFSDMDYGNFDCVVDYWSQTSFSGIEFIHLQDTEHPDTEITSGPSGWIRTNNVTFIWTGSDDRTATRDLVYSYKLNDGSWSGWTSSTTRTYSNLAEGLHNFYVKARDESGKEDPSPATRQFSVDTVKPNASTINPGCLASNSQWQNTCRDPNFSWSATDPNGSAGSGVGEYAYLWSASPTGDPTAWGTATRYEPPPIADEDDWAQYYLHVKAKDRAGNVSNVGTFGLWYDGTAPTATIAINNGAETAYQTTVQVHLSAGDTGSGVAEVRLSHNGFAWSAWQPYADVVAWGLPALNRRAVPVYVQVRDRAGNLSTVVSDTIMLDLYPVAPHSAGFRICNDVINVGGSVGLTSTTFSLISAIGQPWQTGSLTSASRQGASGFLADLHSCRPISYTVTDDFTLHSWVIASGGNLRSSVGFRLGDTAGQPAASGTNAFRSANYILSSGFWGNVIAPACPAPLTGIRVTGPATGTVNTALTFTAHVTPTDASTPLTTTWTPAPQSGQGTTQAVYQWATAGDRTVTAMVENCGGTFSAAHTVEIESPPSPVCETPLTGIAVTGPVTGIVGTLLNFEVAITPTDATPPIVYTWSPAPETGQGTTKAAYRYNTTGDKTITIAAENCGGAFDTSRTVSILLAPPSGFGVSINNGALYTNDANVTVRTWTPGDITEMRLSNDGAYSDEGWQPRQETALWAIETYGNYVLPRTVYIWFKNAQNQVYGPYSDDIIYDPVPPIGAVNIQSRDGDQVTLRLSADDDNSGVAEMRIAASESAILQQVWQPFAAIATVTLPEDVAYVQFRDHAGNLSSIYSSDGSASQHWIYLPLVLRGQ